MNAIKTASTAVKKSELSPRLQEREVVIHRIQESWKKWRQVSEVFCDKRMPMKLNGNLWDSDKASIVYES